MSLNYAFRGSHFAENPTKNDYQRSKFAVPHGKRTTFNAGKLVPFYLREVLPGDTFDVNTSSLVRMSTPIYPVMDDCYLDYYYFFVPARLCWDHWVNLMGQNDESPWTDDTVYEVPGLIGSSTSVDIGSVADYLGVPVGNVPDGEYIQILPFRAYQKIWNDWFRDENLQYPLVVQTGDTVSSDEVTYFTKSTYLLPVNKYHDYFTSCLPAPLKGADVNLLAGTVVPVITKSSINDPTLFGAPLLWNSYGLSSLSGNNVSLAGASILSPDGTDILETQEGPALGSDPSGISLIPQNLYVDLTKQTQVTVSMFRQAFQLQKLLEADARGGTRYTEIINSHFGVSAPDGTLQRSQYLGGKSIPVTVSQVVQTAPTVSGQTPIGHTSAYSKTIDSDHSFTASFVEHGFVIGVCCARARHSYSQGLHKLWSRKSRYDYYWPVFANLSEQPVYKREIYLAGNVPSDPEVLGYQEYAAEYRYAPTQNTAYMRPGVTGSLDVWHYGDYYTSAPTLSDSWIREPSTYIGRTLATTTSEHQFIAQFHFNETDIRNMPVYSIPGLLDHH